MFLVNKTDLVPVFLVTQSGRGNRGLFLLVSSVSIVRFRCGVLRMVKAIRNIEQVRAVVRRGCAEEFPVC